MSAADWGLAPGALTGLAPAERAFAELELDRPPAHAARRLEALGFRELGRVLDAGCGIGQWTRALAETNPGVVGLDRHPGRVALARRLLAADPGAGGRADVLVGDLLALPFRAAAFDAVFCYGVLMLVDASRALAELARVVRPGGRFYACVNGPGWSLLLARERGLVRIGARTVARTLLGRARDRFHTPAGFTRLARRHGIVVHHTGPEGSLRLGARRLLNDTPVYPAKYGGLTCVFEVLGERLP